MIIDTCQRFTLGRESRRPARELINPAEYDVEPIASKDVAADFVAKHHYIRSPSSTAHRFGLYRRGELVGVALFGPPASTNAHRAVFPTLSFKQAVSLGRLVLLDEVPGNGETWFVSRCFELLARPDLYRPFYKDGKTPRVPIVAVESTADPFPRTDLSGEVRFKGHLGIIYQALSFAGGHSRHTGRTNRATINLLPDGTVLSNRTQGKLVRGERGETGAVEQLVSFGATPPAPDEDEHTWLKYWRGRLTRNVRHPGNFRYLWCLDRRRRHEVLDRHPQLAYPKFHDN